MPSRIPRNDFLSFGTDIFDHFRNKLWIGKPNFIRTNMKIRYIKSLANFIYQQFKNFHSFRALHIMTECTDKSLTMPRHIKFRN